MNSEKRTLNMIILIFLVSAVLSASTSRVEIPIGTIFKKTGMEEMHDVINAMSYAIECHSNSNRSREFTLKFYVDKIDTVDPYKLTKVICKQVRDFLQHLHLLFVEDRYESFYCFATKKISSKNRNNKEV